MAAINCKIAGEGQPLDVIVNDVNGNGVFDDAEDSITINVPNDEYCELSSKITSSVYFKANLKSCVDFVRYMILDGYLKSGVNGNFINVFDKLIDSVEKNKDTKERAFILYRVARSLAEAGFYEKALIVFDKSIAATEKNEDIKDRTSILRSIALFLSQEGELLVESGSQERAMPLFDKSIIAAEKIKDADTRSYVLCFIKDTVDGAGLKDKVTLSVDCSK